ncbi:MAG TPA: penicillin acylase family protein [Actinospica sp.]|nr:penicillin acylase family protein [Actinospica sp.]
MATTSGPASPVRPIRARRRLLWRGLGAVAALLALVLAAGAGFAWWRLDHALHASYPQTSGTLPVPGLTDSVTVDRDGAGIPQIYAATAGDLFLAEGYVQAQDRFWQMDVSRHYAAGTLASVLGGTYVRHDELARTLGWRALAEQSYGRLQPQTRTYLQAYAQGVNDYLATHPGGSALSFEYSVLGLPDTHSAKGYTPARWTPVDSLAWLQAGSWNQDGAIDQEVARALLSDTLTSAQIAQLYPPDGEDSGFAAWAVSGKLSSTGSALLASAPIAAPALPSAWYQIGLHCTSVSAACPFDVAGYTEPGIPGVLIGHDQSIAWSWNGRAARGSELYLEKVTGSDYSYDGHAYPLTRHQETIDVADGSPVTITVRATGHGPLLSDVSSDFRRIGRTNGASGLSVESTSLQPNVTADALFAIDHATDWGDFSAAAAEFTAPDEGMVYADHAGNIGYQGPAALPDRAPGDDGSTPVAGWNSTYAWTASASNYATPVRELNPADGYIAGAPGGVTGIRAARTAADLEVSTSVGQKLTAAQLAAIQGDAYDPEAAILVPYLLKVGVDDFTQPAVALLKRWDYTEPAGSSAAAYYNAVWAELLKLVIDRELPEDELDAQLALNGSVRWDAVVNALLQQPGSTWWGDSGSTKVSARDSMLARALEKARLDLTSLMGKDVATWTWGRVHTITPENQTLGAGSHPALVKWLLDGESLGVAGGGSDVATADWNVASGGFAVGAAPALRMVVDLGTPDDSRWIGQTGESGHAGDADYLDQAAQWAAGETATWAFSTSAVRAATQRRLTLAAEGH